MAQSPIVFSALLLLLSIFTFPQISAWCIDGICRRQPVPPTPVYYHPAQYYWPHMLPAPAPAAPAPAAPAPAPAVVAIPAAKILPPKNRILVELNDAQFIQLSKEQNLVAMFNEGMKSGQATNRIREAQFTIYNNAIFPIYSGIVQGTGDIAPVNAAIQRVKDDLKTFFGMEKNLSATDGRHKKQYWTYDIFLFRAILELYQRMFDTAYDHHHFIQNGHFVCPACVAPTGEIGNIGTPGGSCPAPETCAHRIDLDAQKTINEENFGILKDFMNSNQIKMLFGGDVERWEQKYLPEYIPLKFDVKIVDESTQSPAPAAPAAIVSQHFSAHTFGAAPPAAPFFPPSPMFHPAFNYGGPHRQEQYYSAQTIHHPVPQSNNNNNNNNLYQAQHWGHSLMPAAHFNDANGLGTGGYVSSYCYNHRITIRGQTIAC